MSTMRRVLIRLAIILLLLAAAGFVLWLRFKPFGVDPLPSFAAARAQHATELVRRGPSPQSYEELPALDGVQAVTYPSGPRSLKAWLAWPGTDVLKTSGGVPVFVYLHGGFAADASDLSAVDLFRVSGFAVLMPTYRGENGNPGDHELFYGELDDVRAALAWTQTQPGLDAARIVVFGHSAGGMLSALLSLDQRVRVLDTGSTGGLYDSRIFDGLAIPFRDTDEERALRLFAPHAPQMKLPHFACVGQQDEYNLHVVKLFEHGLAPGSTLLRWQVVPGDHQSAVSRCVSAYLERVLPVVRRR